jgi:sugar O-acyltransferase (sialic acid O-acetyltransferase NeuD family)
MKRLVIFGFGDTAELAHHYFSTDSDYRVAGFTVDSAFLPGESYCGLPMVPFEGVEGRFPPGEHSLFVAIGYSQLNELRSRKVAEGRAKGYPLASYVSSRATVLTREPIKENCFVLEDNTIQPFARIGSNVTLWSGNHIGHHSTIGDGCFITSHVVISGGVKVGEKCFIGVNATLRDHIVIGDRCVIGAGAVIMEDAAPGSVFGPPATKVSPVPSSRLRHI